MEPDKIKHRDTLEANCRVRHVQITDEEVARAVLQRLTKDGVCTEIEAQETFLAVRAQLPNGPVWIEIEYPLVEML